MKHVYRGIAVGVVQCLVMLSLAGKYAWDREHLPRAWARALPYDPNLPIRGRYVSLSLEVDTPGNIPDSTWGILSARDGRLFAEPAAFDSGVHLVGSTRGGSWRISEPVDFFISEHVSDPSRRPRGEELWVEVSVPPRGAPRPIHLAVKKDGVLTPLELR